MNNENKPDQLPLFPEPDPAPDQESQEPDKYVKILDERIRMAKEKETTVIESDCYHSEGLTIPLEGNKRIYISPHDVDLFYKLRDLPDEIKIRIFQISIESMEKFIQKKRLTATDYMKELLAREWYWRESSEPVELVNMELPEFDTNLQKLKEKLATARIKKPNLEEIRAAIDLLVGDHSEVYYVDETGERVYGEEPPLFIN